MVLSLSILVMFIGFILSVFFGVFLIPVLKKLKAGQSLSIYLSRAHNSKSGTPTMGGLIFIIPVLVIILCMFFFGKFRFSYNLVVLVFTFVSYAFIGFIDDFLIIIKHNNKGLSVNQKFFLQLVVSVIFFYLFMKGDNEPLLIIRMFGIRHNIGFFYGIVILFILVASSNAVNITDGLDGLACGLSIISFICVSILAWNADWLEGYREIALFGFSLVGCLFGFLMFNCHPARVFMGDTGSLCLGATLACFCILTRHEFLLIFIGIVFVFETITCLLQICYYKITHKRLFPITPIHHTFERYYDEVMVVKIFWIFGVIGALISIVFVFVVN
jgi:phospho-N-acetylmuramoyl-pentapeptide-transferase